MPYHRMLVLVLVVMVVAVVPGWAQAQDDVRRTVTVGGEGIVRVEPDMATVHFGVVTEADDPETARQQNAEAASRAMNAIRAMGVPERKLRLETLRLQPAREYDPETRRYRENGYEAMRQVVVELDSLNLLPLLVAEVVEQGANRLNGVRYDLQDRTPPRNEALQQALVDAREKARLMAETLEVSLGPVLQINEQSFNFPRPVMQMDVAEAARGRAMATPEPEAYAAGEIEVQANVQVVFRLE